MKLLQSLIFLISPYYHSCHGYEYNKKPEVKNDCVTFTVSQGTGCAWMCSYCANTLQTNNYYFTDGVCSYQQGVGCVGNPIAGKSYTCCSL